MMDGCGGAGLGWAGRTWAGRGNGGVRERGSGGFKRERVEERMRKRWVEEKNEGGERVFLIGGSGSVR